MFTGRRCRRRSVWSGRIGIPISEGQFGDQPAQPWPAAPIELAPERQLNDPEDKRKGPSDLQKNHQLGSSRTARKELVLDLEEDY